MRLSYHFSGNLSRLFSNFFRSFSRSLPCRFASFFRCVLSSFSDSLSILSSFYASVNSLFKFFSLFFSFRLTAVCAWLAACLSRLCFLLLSPVQIIDTGRTQSRSKAQRTNSSPARRTHPAGYRRSGCTGSYWNYCRWHGRSQSPVRTGAAPREFNTCYT